MAEKKRVLKLDHNEHGIAVKALNNMRNDLIKDNRPTKPVDELLLKTIDAPTKRDKTKRCRCGDHGER